MVKSKIIYGNDLTNLIVSELSQPDTFLVVDENVYNIYKHICTTENIFILPAGEDSKSFSSLEKILECMLNSKITRKGKLIALGGGVTGDIGGFAAAVYMRGIAWVNIPTTLLSQVDSSVGGKTAVNVSNVKNSAGAFHLPEKVYISQHFLGTLSGREWLCGTGEVVKTAFLSKDVYDLLFADLSGFSNRNTEIVSKIVQACIAYKENVVSQDFKETGLRKVLNVGHTMGHAFESADNHRRSHGEYVLLGMYAESFFYADKECADKVRQSVKKFINGFPDVEVNDVISAAKSDKKNSNAKISVMQINEIGNIEEIFITEGDIRRTASEWKYCL